VAGETCNARSAQLLSGAIWHKSSHSGAIGNCVELAPVAGGLVAIRNSRNPRGPVLIHHRAELTALLADIKDGKFDDVAH
jgi:light-regulated signal transduction histidine kinase (bacteriophytochrome)